MQNLSVKERGFLRLNLPVIFSFIMFSIRLALSKTNLIRVISCLLSFFIFNSALPQQKNTLIEDDYETLKGKIRLYFNSSVDRSLMYAEQMAKSSNYKHLAFANGVIACLLQTKGQTRDSQKKYKAAFYYLEKMPESHDKTQLKAYIYNYGGIAEWSRGNYGKALENYKEGLKFAVEINDIKQIIKIKGNIAQINEAVGNYQLTIRMQKELSDFIDKNEGIFTKEELLNYRSNMYRSLGSTYESYFTKNLNKRYLLDSAGFYYTKTIKYSEMFIENKIFAQLCLGNVYNWKHDLTGAEKMYRNAISSAEQSNQDAVLAVANYNLGDIYLSRKNYIKALSYYKKSDSLTLLLGNALKSIDYLKSNFYQAKIYTILKQPDLAYKHSKIYLDNYEQYEAKISKEALEVNYKQGEASLTAEMLAIQKEYEKDLLLTRSLKATYVVLIIGAIFFLIKSIRDKRKVHKKIVKFLADVKINEAT